jgi:hypothetical protein
LLVGLTACGLARAAVLSDISENEVASYREFIKKLGVKEPANLIEFQQIRQIVVSDIQSRGFVTVVRQLRSEKQADGKVYFEEETYGRDLMFSKAFKQSYGLLMLHIIFHYAPSGDAIAYCNFGHSKALEEK